MDRQTKMYDNLDKVEQKTIKEIMNVFSHEDKIEFSYLNEEIFIKTKKQNIYINIPVLDLCNSLLQN